ncbi:MAG TPA: carbohydrate ABC transporter permease [Acholeplasmataceae bacterium]|nr:carbohydrate ABC transporter permease [Acholeplasmataceae bacterium]
MQLTKRQVRRRKIRKFFFGSVDSSGFLSKLFLYVILIGISFIFLYPVLKMTVTSFMSLEDLIDPTVNWVPSVMMLENYTKAAQVLNFKNSLWDSILVSLVPTVFSVLSSALIGYGFSQYEFPGKKIWFAAVVLVFLVPTILLSIPTYVLYNSLGLLKSLKAYMYPAMLGFGLRQPVFIFIFYQFFNGIPHELSEAAEVDGANAFQTFIKIAVPLAIPAFIITTLYSFVWYWNETNLAISYFQGEYTTLQIAVSQFENMYWELFPGGNVGMDSASQAFNEGVLFAGTMLSILPLLVLYAFTQKWFVESADRAGIAGN